MPIELIVLICLGVALFFGSIAGLWWYYRESISLQLSDLEAREKMK